MTRSIAIKVRTKDEGLELIETLSRQGFPAALVSRPLGLSVEIPARRDGLLPRLARLETTVAHAGAATPTPLRAA